MVEEAQAVLGNLCSSGEGPYVTWVKEARKYDLGAVLITQQPGAISGEILSQGDNWFTFHLLSAGDLKAIKNANAYFSDDILSSLLNEPIPGQGMFWSSVIGKSYPILIRVLSFEEHHQARDQEYHQGAAKTAALSVRERFARALALMRSSKPAGAEETERANEGVEPDEEQDALGTYEAAALEHFQSDQNFLGRLRRYGVPWCGVTEQLKMILPEVLSDRDQIAYGLVPKAMSAVFGERDVGWTTEKREARSGSGYTTWVVVLENSGG